MCSVLRGYQVIYPLSKTSGSLLLSQSLFSHTICPSCNLCIPRSLSSLRRKSLLSSGENLQHGLKVREIIRSSYFHQSLWSTGVRSHHLFVFSLPQLFIRTFSPLRQIIHNLSGLVAAHNTFKLDQRQNSPTPGRRFLSSLHL